MSKFKIVDVKIAPFEDYDECNGYEFKNINLNDNIRDKIMDSLKSMKDKNECIKDIQYENKIYRLRLRYTDDSGFEYSITVADYKSPEIKNEIEKFMPFVNQIIEKKGEIVSLEDLPITNQFYDFSLPFYRLKGDRIILSIEEEGPNFGSAGGPTMATLANIAIIYISGKNGEKIKNFCRECHCYTTEE